MHHINAAEPNAMTPGAKTPCRTLPSSRHVRKVEALLPPRSVPVQVASCRGHTLALKGTLLSEALARGAAGLCVADCNAYIQVGARRPP